MHFFISFINFLIDSFILFLLIQALLERTLVDRFDRTVSTIVQITNPIIKPMSRVLPSFNGFNMAILFCMLVLQCFEDFFLMRFQLGFYPNFLAIIVVALASLGIKVTSFYFWVVLLRALMNWIPVFHQSRLGYIIDRIASSPIHFVQRFTPMISGVDLSSIFLILLLKFSNLIVFPPIMQFGYQLAF